MVQTLFNQPSQKKWICKSESIVLHFLPKGFVVIEILSEIGEYVIFQKNNVWYPPFSCVSLMSFFTLYLTTKRNSETFLKVMKICLKRNATGKWLPLSNWLSVYGPKINHSHNELILCYRWSICVWIYGKYVLKRVPDIVCNDNERQSLYRMKDNSHCECAQVVSTNARLWSHI